MTKNDIKRILTEAAERHGFIAEETQWSNLVSIREADTHYLNFTVIDRIEDGGFDLDNRTATSTVYVWASLASMGGNPTADELLIAADTIRLGAELVTELEAMSLSFTENW